MFMHMNFALHSERNDVVHCVRVSLSGPNMAEFWLHASLVGIALYFTLTLYNIVDIRGHSMIVRVMGGRPDNVARGIS